MSTLQIQVEYNFMRDETIIRLRDHGLGSVVIDQLPGNNPLCSEMIRGSVGAAYRQREANEKLMDALRTLLSPAYFYCAPRAPHECARMTYNQAVNTANYLRETN